MLDDNIEFIELFEHKLAAYTGFQNAVTVDCCTNGILITLESLSRAGKVDKQMPIEVPRCTYMSVPMTLQNNGWKVELIDNQWEQSYQIGKSRVYDAAVDFEEGMASRYDANAIVCVSFQQKKRLALGRGGAILCNDQKLAYVLKRMRYDGRVPSISDRVEIVEQPESILCGYHCYMEPDKAAKGILLLNQPHLLPPYALHSWREYVDLSQLWERLKTK